MNSINIHNQLIEFTCDSLNQTDINDIKGFLAIGRTKGIVVNELGASVGHWYIINPKHRIIQTIESEISILSDKLITANKVVSSIDTKLNELKVILKNHKIKIISHDIHLHNGYTLLIVSIEFEKAVTDYQMKVLIKHPFTFPNIKYCYNRNKFIAPSNKIIIDIKIDI